MNIMDVVNTLNASGVPFVRDVWIKQPEGHYGTVSISAERVKWADNRPAFKQITYAVRLFSPGTGDDQSDAVEQAIMQLPKLRTFTKGATEYMDGDDLVRREWSVVLEGGYHG